MSVRFWTVGFISMAFATAALGQLATPTVTSVSYTSGDMNVQISPVTGATEYEVTTRNASGVLSTLRAVAGSNNQIIVNKSLFPATTPLNVTIVALSREATLLLRSAASAPRSTYSPPRAPSPVATPGLNKITLSWPTVPGAASYRATLSNGMSVVTASTTHVFTGLPTATSFNLLMWAYDANGQEGAASTAIVAKTANVMLD